jgi:hypothetical protein
MKIYKDDASDHSNPSLDFDSQLRTMKFGDEAQEMWQDVAMRIAEATEHMAMFGGIAHLAMVNHQPTKIMPLKHRMGSDGEYLCPVCYMMKHAKPLSVVAPPNGGWNVAR